MFKVPALYFLEEPLGKVFEENGDTVINLSLNTKGDCVNRAIFANFEVLKHVPVLIASVEANKPVVFQRASPVTPIVR